MTAEKIIEKYGLHDRPVTNYPRLEVAEKPVVDGAEVVLKTMDGLVGLTFKADGEIREKILGMSLKKGDYVTVICAPIEVGDPTLCRAYHIEKLD